MATSQGSPDDESARLRGAVDAMSEIIARSALWVGGEMPPAVRASLDRVSGMVNDVEERIATQGVALARAHEALLESEGNARSVFDSIPGLVALLTPTGEVQAVNQQILAYTGQTLEEVKQWASNGTVHPDDNAHVVQLRGESIQAGRPYQIEHRIRRADGTFRWFHNSGFPLRDGGGQIALWCVLMTDIDERKEVEDALSSRERDFRQIIDAIPAQVWSARPDGGAEFFNRYYQEFAGLSEEKARGWGWTELLHPDDQKGLAAAWQRIMASEAPGEAEARLRRHDGAYRWFLFRASPLRDEEGRVVKWYGVNTDIEDRKHAEQALNVARSELEHVARVTTLSTLTSSIAHEVNQPLSGIITNAATCLRMLDADPPNLEGARGTARRTIRDGHRASEVVTRLRALFSRRPSTVDRLDLNDAIHEVIALAGSDLQRNRVALQLELADRLPRVDGDRIQLQQVLINLIRNALDAMIRIDGRPPRLMIRTEREVGDRVRVSVSDTGVGIDPSSAHKLFDAFYTTKEDGMGIGLWVSQSIVERHRGRLRAEPNDGPGATFSFSIPCAGGSTPSTSNTSASTDTKV